MIRASWRAAFAQLTGREARPLLLLGVALNLALLFLVYGLFLALAYGFEIEGVAIPLAGEVRGLGTLLSLPSLALMFLLSVALMVPVSSAFTALFLEDVARTVEARHYPRLPPARRIAPWDALVKNFNLLALLLGANVGALFVADALGPFSPLLFLVLNGVLLGREYFVLAAMRRLEVGPARRLHLRHIWPASLAGLAMMALLLVPVVNLVVPVVAAGAFTHIVARLGAPRSR